MYGASSISNGAVQKYDPFKSTMCNRIPINTELLLLKREHHIEGWL